MNCRPRPALPTAPHSARDRQRPIIAPAGTPAGPQAPAPREPRAVPSRSNPPRVGWRHRPRLMLPKRKTVTCAAPVLPVGRCCLIAGRPLRWAHRVLDQQMPETGEAPRRGALNGCLRSAR